MADELARPRLHGTPRADSPARASKTVSRAKAPAPDSKNAPISDKGTTRASEEAFEAALRAEIVATAQAMVAMRLSPGRSGNVSARAANGGLLITPSGMPFAALTHKTIVAIDAAGHVEGLLQPSSEWRLHAAVYAARPDAAAIVHCHSPAATAIACAGHTLPPFHYMIALGGGDDVPLVPYLPFGSDALAEATATAMLSRRACLLAHHGQVAAGESLAQALEIAETVEWLAEMYGRLLSFGGVRLLGEQEMAGVLAQFESYGQQSQPPER